MCEIVELHREKSTTHVYSKCETLTCDNRSQQPPAHTPRARRVVGKGRLRKLLLVLVEHELEVLLYTSRHTRITHAHGHTGTATGTATGTTTGTHLAGVGRGLDGGGSRFPTRGAHLCTHSAC